MGCFIGLNNYFFNNVQVGRPPQRSTWYHQLKGSITQVRPKIPAPNKNIFYLVVFRKIHKLDSFSQKSWNTSDDSLLVIGFPENLIINYYSDNGKLK